MAAMAQGDRLVEGRGKFRWEARGLAHLNIQNRPADLISVCLCAVDVNSVVGAEFRQYTVRVFVVS